MILTKIIFILLIIICSVFYVLYVWDFSLVLLIVISLIPLIMFISLFLTKRKVSAQFKIRDKAAAKGEIFDVMLMVQNKSIFPVGKAEAVIEYYNIFNNQINEINLHFPVQAKNSHCLTFQTSSKFCGVIKLKCTGITLYDPLRIFKFRVAKNISDSIAILPEGHEISAFLISTERENDESSIYSDSKPGDDVSEVFDLREYRIGDKLNRVHWKLSSKKDDWIIREYSLPVDSPTAIFLNLWCPEDSEYTLPLFDTLLETFVSFSQFLIENERLHSVIYYDASEKEFTEQLIDSMDTLSAVICRIILSIRDDLLCEKPEVFFSNLNKSWTSFSYITADDNSESLMFADEKTDADVKNAIVIVKNEDSPILSGAGCENMSITPVFIGKVTSSVKDIEI